MSPHLFQHRFSDYEVQPCPSCSFTRQEHPLLTADLIRFPRFAAGLSGALWDRRHPLTPWAPAYWPERRTRWHVTDGCYHAMELANQEWFEEGPLKEAWRGVCEGMLREMETFWAGVEERTRKALQK